MTTDYERAFAERPEVVGRPDRRHLASRYAEHTELEHRVTPLELFFDLVFVVAFTQVTTMLS